MRGLSLVVGIRVYSLVAWGAGSSLQSLLLLQSMGSSVKAP